MSLDAILGRDDWDLCHLGHNETIGHDLPGPFVLWPSTRVIGQAHCYLVRSAVLPELCRYLEAMVLRSPGDPAGATMSPDAALHHFRRDHPRIRTLIAAPAVAVQRSTASDLSPRWFDRMPVLRIAAETARRVLRGRRKEHRAPWSRKALVPPWRIGEGST